MAVTKNEVAEMKNEQEKLEDFLKSELMKEGDEILAEIEADDHIGQDDQNGDPFRTGGDDVSAVIEQPAPGEGSCEKEDIDQLDNRKRKRTHPWQGSFRFLCGMGSKGASPLEGDCCFRKKSENVEHRDF